MTAADFTARLEGVRRSGSGWIARCPSHDDRQQSLSIGEGDNGGIVVNCFAGCPPETIVAAVGVELRDLMPERKEQPKRRTAKRGIVATYDYRDENGALLYQVVRYESKDFKQRQPNGSRGWLYNLKGVRRVLYRLPELLAADPSRVVYLPEGEKDVDRLTAHGLLAVTNAGGASNWTADYAQPLTGRHVVVLVDNDEAGRKWTQEVTSSLDGKAASVRALELPGLPIRGDVSDWLDAGGSVADLESLAAEVPTWKPLITPELSQLLTRLVSFVRRFVILSVSEARVLALFIVHTHAVAASETTPFLIVRSPERECGKTRLLEILELLVRRPLRAASLSAAALYSSVQEEEPTLLLDEMDGVFDPKQKENDDLRRLLNAGNRRGSVTIRCAWEQGKRIRERFETFCPRVLAGIGRMPETIESRAFIVQLRRRTREEVIERLGPRERKRVIPEASELSHAVETWASANIERLRESNPEFPAGLKDRQEEGAQPLLAIADLAGEEWAENARLAISEMVGRIVVNEETLGVRLLRDCRDVFDSKHIDRIASSDLAAALVAIEESPWGEASRGKDLTVRTLAALLNPYGITTGSIRQPDGKTPKGYKRSSFEEAWSRYLPPWEVGNATPPQANTGAGSPHFSERHTNDDVADEKRENINAGASCGVVADENLQETPPLATAAGEAAIL